MKRLDQLLAANENYVRGRHADDSAHPRRKLAIVTCMDARIDVFAALGLQLGEALILRNAGGRVTEDVLRSLALATHVLGIDAIVLMQHTGCGLEGRSDAELQQLTGADLGFLPITDHKQALQDDIKVLEGIDYLSHIELLAGLQYDVLTGEVQDVTRIER